MAGRAKQERIDQEVEALASNAPKGPEERAAYLADRLIDLRLSGWDEADRVVIEDRLCLRLGLPPQ